MQATIAGSKVLSSAKKIGYSKTLWNTPPNQENKKLPKNCWDGFWNAKHSIASPPAFTK